MSLRFVAITLAGATLGVAAAFVNETSLLPGLTGGVLVGEIVALLLPRDGDDGGVAEEAPLELEPPLPDALPTRG